MRTHTHREGLRACADNLNKRHRNAQLAGRASVELHTLIFFKDRTVLADARVTKARGARAAADTPPKAAQQSCCRQAAARAHTRVLHAPARVAVCVAVWLAARAVRASCPMRASC